MTAVQPPAGLLQAAELTAAMNARFGERMTAEAVACVVGDVLAESGHPDGEPVPKALARTVGRRRRAASHAADPALRPPRSDRAEAIARALAGRRP